MHGNMVYSSLYTIADASGSVNLIDWVVQLFDHSAPMPAQVDCPGNCTDAIMCAHCADASLPAGTRQQAVDGVASTTSLFGVLESAVLATQCPMCP